MDRADKVREKGDRIEELLTATVNTRLRIATIRSGRQGCATPSSGSQPSLRGPAPVTDRADPGGPARSSFIATRMRAPEHRAGDEYEA